MMNTQEVENLFGLSILTLSLNAVFEKEKIHLDRKVAKVFFISLFVYLWKTNVYSSTV